MRLEEQENTAATSLLGKRFVAVALAVVLVASAVFAITYSRKRLGTIKQDNESANIAKASLSKKAQSVKELEKLCDLTEDEEGSVYFPYTPKEDDGTLKCTLDAISAPENYRKAIINAESYPGASSGHNIETVAWNNFKVTWTSSTVRGMYLVTVKDDLSTVYAGDKVSDEDPDAQMIQKLLFPNGESEKKTVATRKEEITQLKADWSLEYTTGDSDVTSKVGETPDSWILRDWVSLSRKTHTIVLLVKENKPKTPMPDVQATTPQQTITPEQQTTAPEQVQTTPTTPTMPTEPSNTYYRNCKAVWDALGHGITKNDPGYSPDLDADGDGFACENRPNY
ncbi:excalibur calcium-binding domain-containing protein [Bifidobacterium olomucense]|uniref:Sodium pump decarboxylase n=1 Tax=Bifidobacterium olomucense TaxID=2675324 RepID=A0A7Y0HUP6_9BIFI|nr:excalibur calcium-binding domain-containing protein [Bifidobacterium sp. DSM 109959]NMM97395.1 sodium pump decarboxylase [Bifidobacterium sp. DSM 109959]